MKIFILVVVALFARQQSTALRVAPVSAPLTADSVKPATPTPEGTPATTVDTDTAAANTDSSSSPIADFSESARAEGLEGSVGNGVKYDTPNKLEEVALKLYVEISKKLKKFKPSKPLKFRLKELPKVDFERMRSVPLIEFKSKMLNQACPMATVETAGDADNPDAFPRCLMEYMTNLDVKIKKSLGAFIREVLSHADYIHKIFDKGGVCEPVAALMELRSDFCDELLDALLSVPNFIQVSNKVQEAEKETYGEAAVLLELSASFSSELNKKEDVAAKIQILQLNIMLKRLWNFLAVSPMKGEAHRLVEVWYNEPVHKWRYMVGLTQFFETVGEFLWVVQQKQAK